MPITVIQYDMENFLDESVRLYTSLCEEINNEPKKMRGSFLPFINESYEDLETAQPDNHDVPTQCPQCKHSFRTGKTARAIKKSTQPDSGQYSEIAMRVLMKVLYATRMARFDLYARLCA